MICPYCSNTETKVLDSRESENSVRRRRECTNCNKRYTTYERVEIDLMVIKKDNRREPFSREKLKSGMIKSIQKRPIPTYEIPSKKIGDKIMKNLKQLDQVAYVRFASVYKEFKDIDDLAEELKGR